MSIDFIRHRRFRSPCHRKGHRRHGILGARKFTRWMFYAYISNLIKTTIDKGYLFSSKHMHAVPSGLPAGRETTAQAILTLRRALSISSTHSVRQVC